MRSSCLTLSADVFSLLLLVSSIACISSGAETEIIEEYRSLLEMDRLIGADEGTPAEGWSLLAGDVYDYNAEWSDEPLWATDTDSAPGVALCMAPDSSAVSLVSPLIPLSAACRQDASVRRGNGNHENRG